MECSERTTPLGESEIGGRGRSEGSEVREQGDDVPAGERDGASTARMVGVHCPAWNRAVVPDALDEVEDRVAFLFAHRVAEDAAEPADVVAEGFILVGIRCGVRHLVVPDEKYGGVGHFSQLFGD